MSSVGQLVPQVTGSPPNMTTKFGGPHIEDSSCNSVDHNYDPVTTMICAMYIVFGIVYTIFGYRCFKASMFLTGFTLGSIVVYVICLQEKLMPQYGNVCVALCAGILFGLITMLIQYVGLFITGFHTGLLMTVAALMIYDHIMDTTITCGPCFIALFVAGVTFAVVTVVWKKVLTIIGTSIYGGAVIALSVNYLHDRTLIQWVWHRVLLQPVTFPLCHMSWFTLALWPTAVLVGLTTQCMLTATEIYHEQSISAQKRRLKAQQTRPITREERAEMKQRKYRYLYQVRTAHGDVISQSYVQALQKKAQCSNWSNSVGGGECSTLQSDSTHLTVLAGSENAPPTDSDDELNQIQAVQ